MQSEYSTGKICTAQFLEAAGVLVLTQLLLTEQDDIHGLDSYPIVWICHPSVWISV